MKDKFLHNSWNILYFDLVKEDAMKQIKALSACTLVLLLTGSTLQAQFVQEKRINASENYIKNQVMRILVTDAVTEKSVEADLTVRGLNPRKPVDMKATSDTTFEIRNYRLYSVSCVEEGYMYYAEKFWPEEKEIHLQQVKLKPLAVGQKTDIRDISFLGNKTEIYHKSKPALAELKEFMILNPNVRIEVIGHVNGPDNSRSQKVYNKASLERAQAVIDYLVTEGIDKDRFEAVGKGNTEMIYPDPQTEWQNEANRRIQIKVISI